MDIFNDPMDLAWEASHRSTCLKKNVGAVVFTEDGKMYTGTNGAQAPCLVCTRGVVHYYGDRCPSIHAEMDAILKCLTDGVLLHGATLYCTHAPCEACMKHISRVGICQVFFDVIGKVDYRAHWPLVSVNRYMHGAYVVFKK